jgi:prophage antirepressor-like protein
MFVGKDVAQALGYAKPENAIATHVDVDDKTTTLIQGTGSNYKSRAVLINESGLYSLILSSKLPQAKAFKRWVTAEVQHCNNCNSGQCSERTTRTKHDVARDCEEPSPDHSGIPKTMSSL